MERSNTKESDGSHFKKCLTVFFLYLHGLILLSSSLFGCVLLLLSVLNSLGCSLRKRFVWSILSLLFEPEASRFSEEYSLSTWLVKTAAITQTDKQTNKHCFLLQAAITQKSLTAALSILCFLFLNYFMLRFKKKKKCAEIYAASFAEWILALLQRDK